MAISFSRPDPSSPSAVSSATFSTARKGFEPAEVREFLRMVAAELARLQERERFLERELRTAQRSASPSSVALDDDLVTKMLGEEAARILQTAREAGSQIKVRAEDGAARLLRDANEEAQRLRQEAEIESSRRRQDAATDAEAELEMAKQHGRDMVNEARAYRERVLGELARRREAAREQIEQLVHGRDRLLQAFERARLVSMDVMSELTPLGEPDEYVDLSPVTGPVPVMVPNKGRPGSADAGAPEFDVAVAEPAVEPDVEVEVEVEPAVEVEVEASTLDHLENVVALFPTETETETEPETEPEPEIAASKTSADDLFARLRASRAETVVERATAAVAVIEVIEAAEPTVELDEPAEPIDDSVFNRTPDAPADTQVVADTPFARRDEALTPLIIAAGRKVKRALADEQNDVLHVLRGKDPVTSVEQLLATDAEQGARYTSAIAAELTAAAVAGAVSVGATAKGATASVKKQHAADAAGAVLLTEIVTPLRQRIARAVAHADGDNAELSTLVRIVYREWKTQHIDEHIDDIARTAFGRGALAGVAPETPIRWVVDPAGPECADAEDNALGGAVCAGEVFPTDHVCAPAHAGCRCMILPAD
ncbi:MAG: DivIVA domain-containing protein [Ilumatobacteraceae bacterium]